jgi:hypothetical protein
MKRCEARSFFLTLVIQTVPLVGPTMLLSMLFGVRFENALGWLMTGRASTQQ